MPLPTLSPPMFALWSGPGCMGKGPFVPAVLGSFAMRWVGWGVLLKSGEMQETGYDAVAKEPVLLGTKRPFVPAATPISQGRNGPDERGCSIGALLWTNAKRRAIMTS